MNIPKHVGIILDGNRRWARQQGLTTMDGHRAGFETLKKIADYALDKGVKEMSVWAFSTENWKRSEEEINGLMDLFRWIMRNQINELHNKNIKLRIIGLREGVDKDLVKDFKKAEELTKDNTRGALNILVNHGGRADIVNAAKRLMEQKVDPSELTEERFAKELLTVEAGDVDLVIRTSESRLSGFMAWDTVYSEIYFALDKLWPDFKEADFDAALEFYASRQRRFGG